MLRMIWTYLSCFSFTTLLATVVVAQTAQVSIPSSNTIAISESDT